MPDAAVDRHHDTATVVASVVSPDRLYREGIEAILQKKGFMVGLSVCNVKEFARYLEDGEDPPDILILIGAAALGTDELSALRLTREAAPDLRIIVFAEEDADPASLHRLISVGVDALLPTDLSAEILVQSLRLVLLGEGFMFTEYVHRLLARETLADASMPELTARELKLLRFMAEGHSNKTIARRLDLSEASVKAQIRRLLRKLGASNRTQAAIWAMKRGLVRADEIDVSADA
jgi:two-component system, NarL family, nitrate/nitrite response regulator NarL